MARQTAEKIAQSAFDLGLLDDRQLQQVWGEFGSRNVDVDDFLQLLVRRELLTNYQVQRLVKGDRSGFFFGEYKVLYLVGSGSFARVYRAAHRETGQIVALKVLRNRFSDNPKQYNQFLREGQLGCELRHPNIVPTYEVVSQGKTHFLVMEFVEGRNLREFVKVRKKLAPQDAIQLMLDITSGLRYAFERGLTHRDLKPSNVLISSNGRAKLVDFGLAAIDESVADSLGEMSNARTIDYAALERATGVRKDDTRSDIFFLGCIFYYMLTGESPLLETTDRVQRLNKSRFQEIIPIQQHVPNLPHSLTIVVNRSMMLDPNKRYQTPAAVFSDLELAKKRLAQGETEAVDDGELEARERKRDRLTAKYVPPEDQPSVMVVESNIRMQDVFRDGFKRAGYRVLLTSDPQRAISRLRQEPTAADCVVFNAQELGKTALRGFNAFAEDKSTQFIPAILLLGEEQSIWKKDAILDRHRVVLPMPITMKQLRAALGKLVPGKSARANSP